MAIIQSGATTDLLTIDVTSKAARTTNYDSEGRDLSYESKETFFAASGPWTPPATPSDMWIMNGSASKTIRIYHISFAATQTTGGVNTFYLIRRSTANSAGTAVAATLIKADTSNATATATAQHYTANPTPGATVGNIRVVRAFCPAPAGLNSINMELANTSPNIISQPITLRGTAEGVALNFNGVALPAGMSMSLNVMWTEE
jgi:hypothetical protein